MRKGYEQAPPVCIDCKKPFRAASRKLADFPGTVVHASKGRCRTDSKRFLTQAKVKAKAEVESIEIGSVKAGLDAFLARRRQRLGA